MRRLALVALVLAGCGGADGLTRHEFVAELDRICADFDAKQEEIGAPDNLQEFAELGPEIQREFDAATERVRDLGEPPEEIEDEIDHFLNLAEEQRELLGELIEAAEEDDLERFGDLALEGEDFDKASDASAKRLGAERCAQD